MADKTATTPSATRVNKTIRISNIPISITPALLQKYLRELDKPLGTIAVNTAGDLHISLAPEPSEEGHLRFQVATVTFSCLNDRYVPSGVHMGPPGSTFEGTVDTHFRGLTPLNNPKDPTIDIIAVTGLAAHAFGSWSSREGNEMWLRDFLPSDMEDNGHRPRVLTYGYDTALIGSHSDAEIYHLSKLFMAAVNGARSTDPIRPLILIGHSLGGLVIKEAIIESSRDSQEGVLRWCIGMLFFGVPHKGLADNRLVGMVHRQPNENLVRDLCGNSGFLRILDRSFGDMIKKNISGLMGSSIVSFYETKDTMTVKEVSPGKWAKAGPYVRMVTEESVRHAAENGQYLPLDADHSSIVKFTNRSDGNYQIALHKLLDIARVGMMAPIALKVPCEERTKICKWLYPGLVDERHIEISGKRQENTGGWLLADYRFTSWRDGSGPRLLWGCGIPGAGKTFLSSLVIDVLDARAGGCSNTALAYIYFNYKDENQQMPVAILRSLIKQLVTRPRALSFPIPKPVRSLYDDNNAAGTTPALKDLQDALAASLAMFMQTFFVFDALDECRENIRKDLLPLIHWIVGSGGRVFLTSRPYPHDIAISLTPTTDTNVDVQRLDLEAKEEDVKGYIERTIQEHTQAQRLITGDLRARVVSRLVNACKGMFLLMHFYIEELCLYPTRKEIERALDNISSTPGAESSLNGTYIRIMDSIRAQHPSRSSLALKALAWILTANDTLTIDELRLAVVMGDGSRQEDPIPFDEAEMSDQSLIVDVCRGLVTIDHGSHTIRFAHYSVHEYLERTCAVGDSANRHLTVALGCLDIVWLCYIEPEPRRDFLGGFYRLQYAKRNLHIHMRACHHIAPTEILLGFVRNTNLMSYHGHLEIRSLISLRYVQRDHGPLHEATGWGSIRLIDRLLDDGADIPRAAKTYTPLHVAASENLVDLVRFWLKKGIEVNATDEYGATPLSHAIRRGGMDAARELLSSGANVLMALESPHLGPKVARHRGWLDLLFKFGLSVEHKVEGKTYLVNAIENDDCALVEFLLQKGAKIHVRSNGRTPLHDAVARRRTDTARLLLQHGYGGHEEDVEEDVHGDVTMGEHAEGEDKHGRFSLSSRYDHRTPAGRLVDARDSDGSTPLHYAASEKNLDMLRLLLSHGIDGSSSGHVRAPRAHEHAAAINLPGRYGLTVLSYANSSSNKKHRTVMIQMLIDAGADLTVPPSNRICMFQPFKKKSSTWLHAAAEAGDVALLKAALDAGVDPHGRDHDNVSPLHFAAHSGSVDAVSLLMETGLTVNLQDENEKTPLHYARGAAIIALLLQRGADIASLDTSGNSPLHGRLSGYRPHGDWTNEMITEEVRLLIEAGAEVNARNKRDMTPLLLAARMGHAGPVSLLLEYGADIEAQDVDQMSAMHHAATPLEHRTSDVISLLVERGLGIEARDINHRTPLWYMIHKARSDFGLRPVRALIEAGADVNAVHDGGVTLLHLAAQERDTELLALLLDAGANTNVCDSNQRTPLHYAVQNTGYGFGKNNIRLLADRGADVNARDLDGNTPLQHLLDKDINFRQMAEIVEVLVSAGADVNTVSDIDQRRPLHLAANKSSKAVLAILIDAGADIHACDSNQRTALHYTTQNIHLIDCEQKIRILANRGADVNARDIDGNTPLQPLLGKGFPTFLLTAMVKALLSAGADVNTVNDIDQRSPLHLAAKECNEQVLAVLIDAGADLHACDRNQDTPLHYAVQNTRYERGKENIRLLADRGADVNARDIDGNTPLRHLFYEDVESSWWIEMVEALVSAGADVNTVNHIDQKSPLHLAASKSSKAVLAMLIDAGANLHACDRNHETPLDIAMNEGRDADITELLVDQRRKHCSSASQDGDSASEKGGSASGEGDLEVEVPPSENPGGKPCRKRRYSIAFLPNSN